MILGWYNGSIQFDINRILDTFKKSCPQNIDLIPIFLIVSMVQNFYLYNIFDKEKIATILKLLSAYSVNKYLVH